MNEPTPRQERYGGGGTNGVDENSFVHTAPADSSVTCIVKFWLCCEEEAFCIRMGTAKKNRRINEQVHCVCMNVRVTITLQHVLLLTLEGLVVPFLVVLPAVDTKGVRPRRDSNPQLAFSRDEIHPVQSNFIGGAILSSLVVPHDASLPRLLCRERPRGCVTGYTAAAVTAAALLLLLLLLIPQSAPRSRSG